MNSCDGILGIINNGRSQSLNISKLKRSPVWGIYERILIYIKKILLIKFGKKLNIKIDIHTFKSAVMWWYIHIIIYVYKCLIFVLKLQSSFF